MASAHFNEANSREMKESKQARRVEKGGKVKWKSVVSE